MSEYKPVFLLSQAVVVEPKGPKFYYHTGLQLNVLSCDGVTPVMACEEAVPTHSKTFHEPCDDDPDPGKERCY